jgi:hypothetical protein
VDFAGSPLIFPGRDGAPFSNQAFNARIKLACEHARVPIISAPSPAAHNRDAAPQRREPTCATSRRFLDTRASQQPPATLTLIPNAFAHLSETSGCTRSLFSHEPGSAKGRKGGEIAAKAVVQLFSPGRSALVNDHSLSTLPAILCGW